MSQIVIRDELSLIVALGKMPLRRLREQEAKLSPG